MISTDWRGSPISGADADALELYEQALAGFQCWRGEAALHAGRARAQAPGFVMAYVLEASLLMCSREASAPAAAQALRRRAAALPANARERRHLAALGAAIGDDYPRAVAHYDALLAENPRDMLALLVAQSLDYLAGESERLAARVERLLPAWSPLLPGYHTVLAMHGFGLEERGEYAAAEAFARRALEMNPYDARAHHVLAHVFEMTGRPERGLELMRERLPYWTNAGMVASHCWWHVALYLLGCGRTGEALSVYDRALRAGATPAVSELIDASALLWRLYLRGEDCGARPAALARDWLPRIGDGFCTFNDLHAMMAFVAAGEWDAAGRLLHALTRRQLLPTHYGEMTRTVGLPACRALAAFGRGDCAGAIGLLGTLPAVAQRLGGSHAQRDVIALTLLEAVERLRRRTRPLRPAA